MNSSPRPRHLPLPLEAKFDDDCTEMNHSLARRSSIGGSCDCRSCMMAQVVFSGGRSVGSMTSGCSGHLRAGELGHVEVSARSGGCCRGW
jgi:hypothetical protein